MLASAVVIALASLCLWCWRQWVEMKAARQSLQRQAADLARELAELRLADARHELVERLADAGGFDWDFATGRIRWSVTLERICGLPAGGFGGTFEHWRGLVHPQDLPRVAKSLGDAIAGRAEYEVVFRVVRGDGTQRWVSGRGRTLRDAEGRPFQLVGVNLDVTELLQPIDVVRASLEPDPTSCGNDSGGADTGVRPLGQRIDLRALVAEVADRSASLLQARGLSLSLSLPPGGVEFNADPCQLPDLIDALLRRVAAGQPAGTTLHVEARVVGRWAVVTGYARELDRAGGGSAHAELRSRIAGDAHGDAAMAMPLSDARQVAAMHGGTLRLGAQGDAAFTLTLPLTPDAARVPVARVGSG